MNLATCYDQLLGATRVSPILGEIAWNNEAIGTMIPIAWNNEAIGTTIPIVHCHGDSYDRCKLWYINTETNLYSIHGLKL